MEAPLTTSRNFAVFAAFSFSLISANATHKSVSVFFWVSGANFNASRFHGMLYDFSSLFNAGTTLRYSLRDSFCSRNAIEFLLRVCILWS